MSASEWLQFISPMTIIVIVAAVLASIPFNTTTNTTATLKPLWLKRTQWGLLAITVLAWLLAEWANHIMTPIIRVNMVAFSQLLLVPTLLALGIITLKRLFQRNNSLSQLCILAKRYLPPIFHGLAVVFASLSFLFIKAFAESSNSTERTGEQKAYDDPKLHTNYNGGYCGKDKLNLHD